MIRKALKRWRLQQYEVVDLWQQIHVTNQQKLTYCTLLSQWMCITSISHQCRVPNEKEMNGSAFIVMIRYDSLSHCGNTNTENHIPSFHIVKRIGFYSHEQATFRDVSLSLFGFLWCGLNNILLGLANVLRHQLCKTGCLPASAMDALHVGFKMF